MDDGQMVWDIPRDEWIARGGSGEVWDNFRNPSLGSVHPYQSGQPATDMTDPTGREPIDWSSITRDCSA